MFCVRLLKQFSLRIRCCGRLSRLFILISSLFFYGISFAATPPQFDPGLVVVGQETDDFAMPQAAHKANLAPTPHRLDPKLVKIRQEINSFSMSLESDFVATPAKPKAKPVKTKPVIHKSSRPQLPVTKKVSLVPKTVATPPKPVPAKIEPVINKPAVPQAPAHKVILAPKAVAIEAPPKPVPTKIEPVINKPAVPPAPVNKVILAPKPVAIVAAPKPVPTKIEPVINKPAVPQAPAHKVILAPKPVAIVAAPKPVPAKIEPVINKPSVPQAPAKKTILAPISVATPPQSQPNSAQPKQAINKPSIPQTSVNNASFAPITATNKLHGFAVSSQQLGLEGPLNFGATYSDLTGTFFNTQYVLALGKRWAVAALGEYGSDQYRFGGTVGVALTRLTQVKVSAERLGQNLPFNFTSGSINQDVSQDAYGLRFQQLFEHPFFQGINAGGYYANAPNQSLATVRGVSFTDVRNIAGATTQGFDAGAEVLLTPSTLVSGNVYYDQVHYNTIFTPSSSQDQEGLGGGIKINQLLGPHFKVFVDASVRQIYDSYEAGINWLPPLKHMGLELSLSGQHLVSHNDTPDSNMLSVQLNWIPGENTKNYDDHFEWGSKELSEITQWVKTPAIYMDRVLAIAEEINTSISGISSTSVSATGGTPVILSGTNLSGATGVTFGGIPGTGFTVLSPSEISVIAPVWTGAPGNVPVLVATPMGPIAVPGGVTYTLAIGDSYNGGIVYSVDGSGTSGQIVSATNDNVGGGTTWSDSPWNQNISGATSLSNGVANSNAILSSGFCSTTASCAALACSTKGTGWYLPSADELQSVANSLCSGGVCSGGFAPAPYRTSTQSSATQAYIEIFPAATQSIGGKGGSFGVRCVQAF